MFAPLIVVFAPLTACGDASPTGVIPDPVEVVPVVAAYPTPGGVPDLAVSFADESSIELTWTQVDVGNGLPASYRVKYASPPLVWSQGATGCDVVAEGPVGASVSCTVDGLDPQTDYEFLLMSYRVEAGAWADAEYSNIAVGRTGEVSQSIASQGIWIDHDELMALPTTGAAWEKLLTDARANPGSANIGDMHSLHDTYTLAAALVCARTGDYCSKARQGVLDAIGTENRGRWLEVGRNLGSYVISADLLGLRADGDPSSAGTRVEEWIEGWLTKRLPDNLTDVPRSFGPFLSAANAAAQEGFAFATVAAYVGDKAALQRAWDSFRTFACDANAPDPENIYLDKVVLDGWAHDNRAPCAINPAGSVKVVPSGMRGAGQARRIDGSLGGDMRRGGEYQWDPGYTQYPWVGLEGFVPAAVVLERAGYPAFEVSDRAVLRTHEYLFYLRTSTGDKRWFDGDRARDIVQLVNHAYGTSFPLNGVAGGGRTVGYTSWTHR